MITAINVTNLQLSDIDISQGEVTTAAGVGIKKSQLTTLVKTLGTRTCTDESEGILN